MRKLKEKHCVPCESGTEPFGEEKISEYMKELAPGWEVIGNKKLKKVFPFENFKQGMNLAQHIALLADQENHHPDLCIHYKDVEVELSTHNIGGLSENDFIMAARIDEL